MSLYVFICYHLSTVSVLGADVDFFFSVCVGGLSGGPPAPKAAHSVVPFTQPTTNQGRFVTSCEVPGRTFGEGGREEGWAVGGVGGRQRPSGPLHSCQALNF